MTHLSKSDDSKLTFNLANIKETRIFPWCCIVLIAIAFILSFSRAIDLNMDKNPGTWAIYAIPHSLSNMVFGHSKKYTSNRAVRDTFTGALNSKQKRDDVNFAIEEVLKLNKKELGKGLYLWENEDKGIIDFVSMAFKFFGFEVQSILYFYFLIIFVSCFVYSLANFNSLTRLVILLQFLIMLYLVLPMASFNAQLSSLIAPRAFPVLSIIASLHCVFFALQTKYERFQVRLVAIQVLIIIFATHLRVVTYWQLLAVAMAGFIGVSRLYLKKYPGTSKLSPLAPLIFLVIGLIGLQFYKLIAIPHEYKDADQPMTRVVWHNIFSGLAFDPYLAQRYKLRIDDRSIMDATGEYLKENNRYDEWLSLGVLDGGGRKNGYPLIHWVSYDAIVREMFFARCREFPVQCLRTSFIYKPLSLVKGLGWAYGLRQLPPDLDIYVSNFKVVGDAVKTQVIETTKKLDENNLRAILWSSKAMLLLSLAFTILLLYAYDMNALSGLFVLAVFSFIPSIVGYPGAHTILDTTIVAGILIYTCLGMILHKTVDLFIWLFNKSKGLKEVIIKV